MSAKLRFRGSRSGANRVRRAAAAMVESLERRHLLSGVPAGSVKLIGTVTGTAGSYINDGDTVANAFDGNLNTYFDGPTANGDVAGLTLAAPASVTQIQYAPRSGLASRMVGGVFQASSSASFSTGVVNLFTVTAVPVVGSLTAVPITVSGNYQYLQYVAPVGSYGNASEIEFDGVSTAAASTKLTGTVIGTAGSYSNDGDTIANAFDGNLSTFFDGPAANGNVVGLNLGSAATISQIQFAARSGYESRMVGGFFQASNSANFSSGNVTLYTITTAPPSGVMSVVPVSATGTYQYVEYVSPAGSYGNVAEIEFDGSSGIVVTPPVGSKLTGTTIGTAGSYGNSGNTIANAFDGNLNTYFDGPTANGNVVGLNLGAAGTISQIQYAPRATFASRMVGGYFQASNSANFSSGDVTLYTITAAPAYGAMTVVPVSATGTYQYVEYVSPAGSYGDVAEIAFYGTPGTVVTNKNKLSGTPIGTAGSYGNSGNTIANAFDGNFATFFDGPVGNGDTVGLNLGSEANLTQLQYSPRATYASRMVGGTFQASNASDFSSGVVTLFTITTAPAYGVLTAAAVTTTGPYQFVRYVGPNGSFGDVAELEFDGTSTGIVAPPVTNPGQPSVLSVNPANGSTGVLRTAFVSCALNLPNVGSGVSIDFLNSTNVYLYQTFTGTMVPSVVNTDGAGGDLVLQPSSPLNADTEYTFVVTSGLEDTSYAHFVPFTSTFTTGDAAIPTVPNIAFAKVPQPTATGQQFTGEAIGPDGDLYASTLTGDIFQFPIAADGTLGNPTDIKTAVTANGAAVIITGLAFDPGSTASNETIWLSIGNGALTNAPNFTGEIATISGPGFSVYQNYVTGLPRSNSNHLNEEPVFGPDGNLYWGQGSLSSMGAPDSVWGYRSETLLSAAILKLNVAAAKARIAAGLGPINVQTDSLPQGQTAYNPSSPGALVTVYASGVRNAFDLVFDTNGHLYAPTNGASATGNIPGTPAGVTPSAPAENDVPNAEDDYLYDITQGGYYGHPDPARGQYIFGGGNPVNPAPNDAIQGVYPLGTNPDPNYQGYAFDFGTHYSVDGAIEYQGSAFGGALNGALLFTRYSGGKDIEALTTGTSGSITGSETGITGFTDFNDPLGIVENNASGYVYVTELGGEDIVMLKPIAVGATANVSTSTVYFNDPTGGAVGPAQPITITNTGNQPLAIPATGISVTGTDGHLFVISSEPALPATIAPGSSVTIDIEYDAGTSSLGLHTATLQIQSNDPVNPTMSVALRALSTAGLGGNLEPSLQMILNLYQIPDNVGTANPNQTYFNTPPLTPNDEVTMQELVKANASLPVTVQPIAAFSDQITPSAGFGYYTSGTPDSRTSVFSVDKADSQSVDVTPQGSTTFDPGTGDFGIFASFDAFPNTATGTARFAYEEDQFNIYDAVNTRKVRFYPLKTAAGTVVPNAYVFATEDYGVAPGYDSNDLVGIIYNVAAAPGSAVIGANNIDGTNTDGGSFPNYLAFNAIQNPIESATTPATVTHTMNTLRINNTGSLPLIITGMNMSNPAFVLPTGIAFPLTIAADSSYSLAITYKPTHTGANATDSGILQIFSNATNKPTLGIVLNGIWQDYGNMLPNGTYTEPTVQQIVNGAFGYGTAITYSGQNLNQNGVIETAGEEVLSPYWVRADANLPVTVEQLDAFHTQGNAATLYGYPQGSSKSFTQIVASIGDNAQSLLPLSSDSKGTYAFGLYYPSGVFGLNVDKSEYSDDTLNAHGGTLDQGHHVRFWPARTPTGALIPNTWIMVMDYTSVDENYDYNDNIYVISNMTPAPPAAPASVTTTGSIAGVTVAWKAVTDPLLAGYDVFRSTSSNGTYGQVSGVAVTGTSFVDTTGTPGTTYYYKVEAFDSWGGISAFSTAVAGVRTVNTTAPAAPKNLTDVALTSGITLNWTANTETDLAGYNVFRATSITGTSYQLNLTILSTPTFTDTSAVSGSPSYYKVVAVNDSGLSSAASTITATRPIVIAPPSAPTGFIANPMATGVNLSWNAVTSSTVAGYNVYRSNTVKGTYAKLNAAGLITTTSYTDATAITGATYFYEVTAVDNYLQESAPATVSAVSVDKTPPAQPTAFTATGTAGGIVFTWTANTEPDLAGYNLLRSFFATGTYTAINSTPITAATYTDTSTTPGSVVFYELTAVDKSGNVSKASPAVSAFRLDLTPPTQPVNFTAANGSVGITLTWTANTQADIAGYNLLRSSSSTGTFTAVNTTPLPGTTFVDTTAPVGQPSYYQLIAVNTSGTKSTAATSSGLHLNTVHPATPTMFNATGGASGNSLSWAANSETDLTGYNIFSATSAAGTFTQLNAQPITMLTYLDTAAVAGQVTYYELFAVDTSGLSSTTPATTSTTRPAAPPMPTGFTSTGAADNVVLTWNPNTEPALSGYTLSRSTSPTGTFVPIGPSLITVTTFTDTTADTGFTYNYDLTAVDTTGLQSPVATTLISV